MQEIAHLERPKKNMGRKEGSDLSRASDHKNHTWNYCQCLSYNYQL